MNKLCELIAGSTLYGLNTPESDVDTRGVFINTDPSMILGLWRGDVLKEEKNDSVFFELVHFFKGLLKTNTQHLEILFAEESNFVILTDEFLEVKKNKYEFISSQSLFKSLIGYIESEKRLASGERTGDLGSKRKNQIEKYGFSPKNFSHLIRLAYCGKTFFETGVYPVNISSHNKEIRDLIFSIKTEPDKYNKDQLLDLSKSFVEELKISFNNRKKDFKFNESLANNLCLKFYLPYLMRGKNE